jgi:hypothetical protein
MIISEHGTKMARGVNAILACALFATSPALAVELMGPTEGWRINGKSASRAFHRQEYWQTERYLRAAIAQAKAGNASVENIINLNINLADSLMFQNKLSEADAVLSAVEAKIKAVKLDKDPINLRANILRLHYYHSSHDARALTLCKTVLRQVAEIYGPNSRVYRNHIYLYGEWAIGYWNAEVARQFADEFEKLSKIDSYKDDAMRLATLDAMVGNFFTGSNDPAEKQKGALYVNKAVTLLKQCESQMPLSRRYEIRYQLASGYNHLANEAECRRYALSLIPITKSNPSLTEESFKTQMANTYLLLGRVTKDPSMQEQYYRQCISFATNDNTKSAARLSILELLVQTPRTSDILKTVREFSQEKISHATLAEVNAHCANLALKLNKGKDKAVISQLCDFVLNKTVEDGNFNEKLATTFPIVFEYLNKASVEGTSQWYRTRVWAGVRRCIEPIDWTSLSDWLRAATRYEKQYRNSYPAEYFQLHRAMMIAEFGNKRFDQCRTEGELILREIEKEKQLSPSVRSAILGSAYHYVAAVAKTAPEIERNYAKAIQHYSESKTTDCISRMQVNAVRGHYVSTLLLQGKTIAARKELWRFTDPDKNKSIEANLAACDALIALAETSYANVKAQKSLLIETVTNYLENSSAPAAFKTQIEGLKVRAKKCT